MKETLQVNFGRKLSRADFDRFAMAQALTLASTPPGCLLPNPRVGAVLAKNGRIHFEGFHRGPGSAHAEAMVIQNALRAGVRDFSPFTLYVSLEPCCHTNKRTPPCAPLVLKHRPKRVVVAHLDPNPEVAGRGVALLRRNGIAVEVGLLRREAEALNQDFIKNQLHQMPYLTLKLAMTFDGKMADDFGTSEWITNVEARRDVQIYRAAATHIGVGARTFDRDNPRLDWRPKTGRPVPRGVLIFGRPKRSLKTSRAARANGVELVQVVPPQRELKSTLKELFRAENAFHIMIEGGPHLAYSLLKQGLIDRVVLYYGKGFLGGKGRFSLGARFGVQKLSHLLEFAADQTVSLNGNIKVIGFQHVYRSHPKSRRN